MSLNKIGSFVHRQNYHTVQRSNNQTDNHTQSLERNFVKQELAMCNYELEQQKCSMDADSNSVKQTYFG